MKSIGRFLPIRLGRNLPIDFMIVPLKRNQTFVFRILPAVNFQFSKLSFFVRRLLPIPGSSPIFRNIGSDL